MRPHCQSIQPCAILDESGRLSGVRLRLSRFFSSMVAGLTGGRIVRSAKLVETTPREWTNLEASIFAIASSSIFALIFMAGRFTGNEASALQIMFLRYLGGLLTVGTICLLRGETWASVQSPRRLAQFWRVVTGALGGVALIYGNANMPLVDANAISLLRVVFLIVLGMILMGDRLNTIRSTGIAVCIAGAVLIVASRGAFSQFGVQYLLPAGVVLAGSFLFALEGFFIKTLAASDRPLVTIAHANLFGVLILLVPALATWGAWGPINFAILMLGPLAILGQYLTIRANALATVSVLAPLSYTSLIVAAVVGWVVFAEAPTPAVLFGAAIIAAGGIILALARR